MNGEEPQALVIGLLTGFVLAAMFSAWLTQDYANDRVDWERLTRVREACVALLDTRDGQVVQPSAPCQELDRFWQRHAKNREGK